MFSHLSCLIDGEGDTAGGEDDNGGRVVVVLITEPQTDREHLEDVEGVQDLLDQEVGNWVKRDQNIVQAVYQTSEKEEDSKSQKLSMVKKNSQTWTLSY